MEKILKYRHATWLGSGMEPQTTSNSNQADFRHNELVTPQSNAADVKPDSPQYDSYRACMEEAKRELEQKKKEIETLKKGQEEYVQLSEDHYKKAEHRLREREREREKCH